MDSFDVRILCGESKGKGLLREGRKTAVAGGVRMEAWASRLAGVSRLQTESLSC